MPLVRIDLPEATSPEDRDEIVEVVDDALVRVAGVPENDRFIVVNGHGQDTLVMDRNYLVARSDQAMIIQITLNTGRTTEVKRALYRTIADGMHERVGMRGEDVFVNLVEVAEENWSFGDGVAQYAD